MPLKRLKIIKNKPKKYKRYPLSNNYQFAVNLNSFSFKYPNTDKFVFNKAQLSLKKNSVTSIIGKSGQGKSTLIKILLGIIPIYLDNQEFLIDTNNNYSIAYVPQKIFL